MKNSKKSSHNLRYLRFSKYLVFLAFLIPVVLGFILVFYSRNNTNNDKYTVEKLVTIANKALALDIPSDIQDLGLELDGDYEYQLNPPHMFGKGFTVCANFSASNKKSPGILESPKIYGYTIPASAFETHNKGHQCFSIHKNTIKGGITVTPV